MCSTIRGVHPARVLISLGIFAAGAQCILYAPYRVVAQSTQPEAGPFVGNRNSKVLHATTCHVLDRTSPASKIEIPNARVATANGFRPCGVCKPLSSAAEGRSFTTVAMMAKVEPARPPAAMQEEPVLNFAHDIAPILVGNCVNCHNATDKARRNNLDLSTVQAMLAGGDNGPVVVASKPSESRMLLRVKGLDGPKMPPGDRELAPETIAKLERWIDEGAAIDPGIDVNTELSSYAPSPETIRRSALAELSREEADEVVKKAGLERWAKATTGEPSIQESGRVMLFSNLSDNRGNTLLKVLNAQVNDVGQLLGPPAEPVLGGRMKLSVFLFEDRTTFAEFVRSVESREIDDDDIACANLGDDLPFLAAIGPAAEEGQNGVQRTLAGTLTEQLAAEATRRAGNPPRWLTLGLGAYLAQRVEPKSPYYNRLRQNVLEVIRLGGSIRAQELIGGQGDEAAIRALGFSMLEWVGAVYRPTFTPFVRAMLADGSRFDDVIQQGYRAKRDEFLGAWATWASRTYARRR